VKASLRTDGIRNARPHCTCVVVQNVAYEGAAEKLGCHMRWLQDNISRIPHQKIGESVAFCDCDLRVIQAMCTRLPDQVLRGLTEEAPKPEAVQQAPAAAPGRPSLHDLRPAGARRRKAADPALS
jgi:hypothetical protein